MVEGRSSRISIIEHDELIADLHDDLKDFSSFIFVLLLDLFNPSNWHRQTNVKLFHRTVPLFAFGRLYEVIYK